jgi:WD40 repeat protein
VEDGDQKLVKKVHLLATGFGNPDTSIALYDLKTWKLERKWKAHEKTVTDLLFFRNKLISVSCDGKMMYWHINFLEPSDKPTRIQTVQAHKAFIFKLVRVND